MLPNINYYFVMQIIRVKLYCNICSSGVFSVPTTLSFIHSDK